MGGSFAALLDRAGHAVRAVDNRAAHVAAIERDGLRMTGALGEHWARIEVSTGEALEAGWADWVIVFTDTNGTRAAGEIAKSVMAADGCTVTMQNGIGNVDALCDILGHGTMGREKVLGGSSMCSAAVMAPGHVVFTHHGPTTLGELDGTRSERLNALVELLSSAGLDIAVSGDIHGKIWNKFILNCGVNALCAVSGMRSGEMARVPELYALQDRIIDEALAVAAAKGIVLPDKDIRTTVKKAAFYRFNKPSMLQHIEAGKKTEIDAINGALVREAKAVGIAVPYNEALVALLKGVETRRRREEEGMDIDYDGWEARIQDEPLPD